MGRVVQHGWQNGCPPILSAKSHLHFARRVGMLSADAVVVWEWVGGGGSYIRIIERESALVAEMDPTPGNRLVPTRLRAVGLSCDRPWLGAHGAGAARHPPPAWPGGGPPQATPEMRGGSGACPRPLQQQLSTPRPARLCSSHLYPTCVDREGLEG